MQTLAQIREMLESRGLSPRKSLGQNFLIDHNLIAKLIDAAKEHAGLGAGSVVLEIGPGTGVLTEALLERGARVVACELDRGLAALLRETLGGRFGADQFTLVEGDCLESKHALNPAVIEAVKAYAGDGSFTLIANLPYGAATPAMMTLLADHPACNGVFVTIQQEVADRMLARAHSKEYGPLSVLVAATCRGWQVAKLPPECFWPRPGVHSAMVAAVRAQGLVPMGEARALVDFAQSLFEQRRKQIGSVLARQGKREIEWPAGIAPTNRAEELSPAQFVELMRAAGIRHS
jgi:16S rRNA (adenine1518-N6/adenine1519-N6)-dimethyltransferase